MKKQLLTAIAVFLSLCGYAQTKGTNTLGFGINSNTIKTTNPTGNPSMPSYELKYNQNFYSLGYGLFIKDNTKVGVELSYGTGEQNYGIDDVKERESYAASVSYQKYFPIVKTLFAYAGGRATYGYNQQVSKDPMYSSQDTKGNTYSVGAYGGVTWFVSKRFAFETSLLSADAIYSSAENKTKSSLGNYKNKTTSFNLSSQGFINNLGFKIYLLF